MIYYPLALTFTFCHAAFTFLSIYSSLSIWPFSFLSFRHRPQPRSVSIFYLILRAIPLNKFFDPAHLSRSVCLVRFRLFLLARGRGGVRVRA